MYKTMKNRSKILMYFCTLLAFLSVFFSSSNMVRADSGITYSIKIKQDIRVNSDYSKPKDDITYVLEAVTNSAPLPDGASGKYTFTINGDGEKKLDISYKETGKYSYKVYQKENKNIKYLTQDKMVYNIDIEVINTVNGLVVKSMVYDGTYHKVTDMEFTNTYDIPQVNPNNPRGNNTGNNGIRYPNGFLSKTGVGINIFWYVMLMLLSEIWILVLGIRNKKED